jgi:hypothetical protein
MLCDGRILLDCCEKACWRSSGSDARSEGEDGEESGGLCEHDVGFAVMYVVGEVVDISWVLGLEKMSRKECRNAPRMSER